MGQEVCHLKKAGTQTSLPLFYMKYGLTTDKRIPFLKSFTSYFSFWVCFTGAKNILEALAPREVRMLVLNSRGDR